MTSRYHYLGFPRGERAWRAKPLHGSHFVRVWRVARKRKEGGGQENIRGFCKPLIGREGVEPTQCHHRRILSPLRLPIPPPPRVCNILPSSQHFLANRFRQRRWGFWRLLVNPIHGGEARKIKGVLPALCGGLRNLTERRSILARYRIIDFLWTYPSAAGCFLFYRF